MTHSIVAPAPRVRTIKLIQHPAFRGAPVQTDRPHQAGTRLARVASADVPSADVRSADVRSADVASADAPVGLLRPAHRSPASWSAFDEVCLAA